MASVAGSARTYKGLSAEERRAERRARLLAAALETWGDHGWAAVTVRGVCAQAGLTDRYFYENFTDREALLLAVYDQVGREGTELIGEAIAAAPAEPMAQMRAATDSFIRALLADPRRARIALVEPAGSPALEQRRRDTFAALAHFIAELAASYLGPAAKENSAWLDRTALFCVGGLNELVTNWLGGGLAAAPEELVDHAVAMMAAAFGLENAARH